jgi:hypothetical protein
MLGSSVVARDVSRPRLGVGVSVSSTPESRPQLSPRLVVGGFGRVLFVAVRVTGEVVQTSCRLEVLREPCASVVAAKG